MRRQIRDRVVRKNRMIMVFQGILDGAAFDL